MIFCIGSPSTIIVVFPFGRFIRANRGYILLSSTNIGFQSFGGGGFMVETSISVVVG